MNRKMSFDSIAWCYDFLSWVVFGNRIKQSQRILLEHIKEDSNILIIGGGTGWIVKELLEMKSITRVDYIESSKKMLDKAKALNCKAKKGVIQFIHGDENSVKQDVCYDAVLACYFFDLFPKQRLEEVVLKLTNSLKPDGRMLVADFNLNANSTLLQRLLVKVMYLFFKLFCGIEAKFIEPLEMLFHKYHLKLNFSSEIYGGFIRSEMYIKK